ncbi:multiple RNA-binding domain-containing protein 1 isoform X1 [Sesamum indicum]|uniref:Multiple RNA-binding domain-containing protein 1 isoform X1 n=2 Tax=Sesamum indicum TaxID=4182 RepID=A0A6I9UFT3_SESIN|nr:multiple RNA-binding domain-containing protein 1 isoform X1 [Sesamum indicum]
MSRICVKNLPKYVAEDRLRDFFSQKGEVTDAKLMRTKDGKSRQFGFVGFRTDHEAQEAINYFNKSFMDTCRITCEIARKVGDPNMPRPWSQHSLKKKENSSEEEKRVTSSKDSKTVVLEGKSKKSKNKKDDENDDPQLQEFLQVMQHRSRSKLWANDTLAAPSLEQSEIASANKVQMTKGRGENLDGEDTDLEGIKGEGTVLSEKQEADKPNNLVHDEVISDMDYFRSRIKNRWSDSESSDDEGSTDGNEHGDGDDDDSTDSQNKSNHGPLQDTLEFDVSRGEAEDGSSGEHGINNSVDPSSSQENKNEEVLESGRLFIRNLPYTATEEELEEHFSKYGTISQVHIVIDKDTRRSKGIAFVLFALPESAARALEEMDSSIFQGRLLHVMPAKQKNLSDTQQSNDAGRQSSKTFKQQRDAERKASEASGNTRAWNSLFMRPDTVVENVARKFGVSKSELLDKESDDLAVRIALGETQVISETKKALSNAGVNISSLEEFAAGKTDGLKRSNHVILVKNLPYGSSESELSNMFGKFGSLDRIVLPPTKTLALVIFLEPAEARAAFKGLAYKRYKDAPLYLEWAPGNILSQTSPAGDNKVVGEHDVKRALLEQEVEETADADVDLDRIESRSLYVKNLNFKTSDDSVKKHFTEHMKGGKILSIRVKKHVKNGKNVSMGFGFIEFDCVDTAVSVCRDLQGTVLDGHALILQLCHAKKDEVLPKKVETDISSTKLIVRNVAFEATEKDLRQLFSPFGQIKSLRLPMRFGKHRGFAFVEYVTKQEARNALQALSNTHLYGRHLVLERAKEGESLEELRARTAAQFTDSDSAKLSKKRKHLTVLDEGNIKFERIAE